MMLSTIRRHRQPQPKPPNSKKKQCRGLQYVRPHNLSCRANLDFGGANVLKNLALFHANFSLEFPNDLSVSRAQLLKATPAHDNINSAGGAIGIQNTILTIIAVFALVQGRRCAAGNKGQTLEAEIIPLGVQLFAKRLSTGLASETVRCQQRQLYLPLTVLHALEKKCSHFPNDLEKDRGFSSFGSSSTCAINFSRTKNLLGSQEKLTPFAKIDLDLVFGL